MSSEGAKSKIRQRRGPTRKRTQYVSLGDAETNESDRNDGGALEIPGFLSSSNARSTSAPGAVGSGGSDESWISTAPTSPFGEDTHEELADLTITVPQDPEVFETTNVEIPSLPPLLLGREAQTREITSKTPSPEVLELGALLSFTSPSSPLLHERVIVLHSEHGDECPVRPTSFKSTTSFTMSSPVETPSPTFERGAKWRGSWRGEVKEHYSSKGNAKIPSKDGVIEKEERAKEAPGIVSNAPSSSSTTAATPSTTPPVPPPRPRRALMLALVQRGPSVSC